MTMRKRRVKNDCKVFDLNDKRMDFFLSTEIEKTVGRADLWEDIGSIGTDI